MTQEGIRLDLEWMQRVGLGGALMFDIGFRNSPVPQYVEHRVGYGTREWEQAVRFAASEAARLGLELGAQSSGGWSVSGGPQVEPEQAMKKLVWSETLFTPISQSVRLPLPPSNNGPYQDVPVDERFREPSRYGDIAVIGYRLPDTEQVGEPRASFSRARRMSLCWTTVAIRRRPNSPRMPTEMRSCSLMSRRTRDSRGRSRSRCAACCPKARLNRVPMESGM